MFADTDYCLPNFSGIVGDMEQGPNWERLRAYALAARGPRSQKAIHDLGGPSDTTLGKIEHAKWRPKRGVDDTIQKLETAYKWAPGSVEAILAGGHPTPLHGEGQQLMSMLRHPAFIADGVPAPFMSAEMVSVLERLVGGDEVDDEMRARIRGALDDVSVERFSGAFDSLSREGKLRVVRFTQDVHAEERAASAGGHGLADQPQKDEGFPAAWTSAYIPPDVPPDPPGGKEPGMFGGEDGEQRDQGGVG